MIRPDDLDAAIRAAAVAHVERIGSAGALTSEDLRAGFVFEGERVPLINPQRGIFKPRAMQYLLSVRTVYPRSGARVWYDDQRRVHDQIYRGEELIDYAFMGTDPNAADNRWLREAWQAQVPVLYFLGIAPGRSTYWSSSESSAPLHPASIAGPQTGLSRRERNVVERLVRRLKEYRRMATPCEKLAAS